MRWKHDKARYFGVKGQDHKLTYLTYWNTAKGRQFLGIFATKELNSLAEILRASGICGFCRQGFLERLNGNYVRSLSMYDNKPSQEEFLIIAETIVSTKNSKESCAPKNFFTREVVIASNVTKTLLEMSQINLSAFQHKPDTKHRYQRLKVMCLRFDCYRCLGIFFLDLSWSYLNVSTLIIMPATQWLNPLFAVLQVINSFCRSQNLRKSSNLYRGW